MNYLETALALNRSGLRVLPVNNQKRPLCTWKEFQTSQTEDDIKRIFANESWGIAMLTGIGGIEAIDIDLKYDTSGALFHDFVESFEKINNYSPALINLTVQKTVSSGFHLIYRTDKPEGNKKLASRMPNEAEDKNERPVLIETRGIGGYIVIAPSPGYELECGSFDKIPYIPQGKRNNILTVARSFDEAEPEHQSIPKSLTVGSDTPPWDEFNSDTHIPDLIETYGWKRVYERGERIFYKRPGNTDHDVSGNYHAGHNLFISHSTSTVLPSGKGLTAFSIFKYYEHGGDSSAAAKALVKMGYGKKIEIGEIPNMKPVNPVEPDEFDKVWNARFNYNAKEEQQEFIFDVSEFNRSFPSPIAGFGQMVLVVGMQKAGKTFFLAQALASAISGRRKLGFQLNVPEDRAIVYIDTEQPRFWFCKTQKMIHDMAGIPNPNNYYAFLLRKYSPAQRMELIKKIIEKIGRVGVLVLDGIVDLCSDFMDNKASQQTIQEIMTISDQTQALTFCVIHLTKRDGFIRGHLGTEAQNKCDAAIEVTKDIETEMYTIKSREGRFAAFSPIQFKRDSEGNAIFVNDNAPF